MNVRGGLFVAGLAAAVAVPYYMTGMSKSDKPETSAPASWWSRTFGGEDPQATSSPMPSTMTNEWGAAVAAYADPRVGGYGLPPTATARPAGQSLAEVLRFDVTPQWVMNRWQRVSTKLWSDRLSGLRVTLISGLSLQDLAGSLTYYFNSQPQLVRIAFEGTTGDPQPLANFVAHYYKLQPDPNYHGQVYVRRDELGVHSALMADLAPVVRSHEPYQRYRIRMELAHPASPILLSQEFQELLDGVAIK